jgi:phosphate starvation-inducible protein PhoH and related proteins
MTRKPTATRRKKDDNDYFDINAALSNNILSNIKLDIKHKNETQKKLTNAIKKNDVTICTGPAGTGKTLLTVFEALTLLKNQPDIYKEIKLVKSITQLKNEDLGTLPGDKDDKLKFHMMSYLDAFYKLIGESNTNKLIEAGLIKMEVFGAIRGRSFTNAVIIVDEFQNITHDNAKTFLTRFSDNTKVIVLGDSGQIDLKDKKESSLERLVNRVKRSVIEGVEVVEFSESDVVRHRLTSYFINMFKEPEATKHVEKPVRPSIRVVKEISFFEKLKKFFSK